MPEYTTNFIFREKGEQRPALMELVDATVTSATSLTNQVKIENMTWRVREGDYWVLGGLPGSGKTDLLLTAAGLHIPLEGRHLLFGQETVGIKGEMRAQLRQRVGLVFGYEGRLFTNLTVFENVALPLTYQRDTDHEAVRHEVEEVLSAMGLDGVSSSLPGELPRTQRQRVALARALVLKPDLLFIDNPVAGLDPRQGFWWLDFLQRLSAGSVMPGAKKVTLVVGVDDLRPWTDEGKQFALIKGREWLPIGTRTALQTSGDPLLQELLAKDFREQEG